MSPRTPPRLSAREHVARLRDVGFWRPHVLEVLGRHDLDASGREPTAGDDSTYPTFLCGDVVVKLFGGTRSWRASHVAERAAQARVAGDPRILAPQVLGQGLLFDEAEALWPYLVTTRVNGVAWREAALTDGQQRSLARELGVQIRLVHALPQGDVRSLPRPPARALAEAARHSSLPPRLIEQIVAFEARLGAPDRVFVHGDLTAAHVFTDGRRLTGIIDWGDAGVADRHYEIIQLYRDLFGCDGELLRVFLESSEWPAGADFARRSLGMGLHRQAVGLSEHRTMDVFEPIAAAFPLDEIATLDELADLLFAGGNGGGR